MMAVFEAFKVVTADLICAFAVLAAACFWAAVAVLVRVLAVFSVGSKS